MNASPSQRNPELTAWTWRTVSLNFFILTAESLSTTSKTSKNNFFAIIYCIMRAWPIFIGLGKK